MSNLGRDIILPASKVWKAVGLFVFLAGLFSLPAYYMTIELAKASFYYAFMMWMPGLAALVTCKIMGIKISALGWQMGESRYAISSYFLPAFYLSLTYGVAYLLGWVDQTPAYKLEGLFDKFGLAGWSLAQSMVLITVIFMTVAVLRSMAHTLGEEIGWRGLLVPLLYQKMGFVGTSILSGGIWFLWHFPILIIGEYADRSLWFDDPALWCYGAMLIGLSFPMTYYRLKSGSLWPAVILHAVHNVFAYSIWAHFMYPTESGGMWMGEFGYLLPILLAFFALYFTRKAYADGLHHKLGGA